MFRRLFIVIVLLALGFIVYNYVDPTGSSKIISRIERVFDIDFRGIFDSKDTEKEDKPKIILEDEKEPELEETIVIINPKTIGTTGTLDDIAAELWVDIEEEASRDSWFNQEIKQIVKSQTEETETEIRPEQEEEKELTVAKTDWLTDFEKEIKKILGETEESESTNTDEKEPEVETQEEPKETEKTKPSKDVKPPVIITENNEPAVVESGSKEPTLAEKFVQESVKQPETTSTVTTESTPTVVSQPITTVSQPTTTVAQPVYTQPKPQPTYYRWLSSQDVRDTEALLDNLFE